MGATNRSNTRNYFSNRLHVLHSRRARYSPPFASTWLLQRAQLLRLAWCSICLKLRIYGWFYRHALIASISLRILRIPDCGCVNCSPTYLQSLCRGCGLRGGARWCEEKCCHWAQRAGRLDGCIRIRSRILNDWTCIPRALSLWFWDGDRIAVSRIKCSKYCASRGSGRCKRSTTDGRRYWNSRRNPGALNYSGRWARCIVFQ